MSARAVARGLAWFGVGLGLVEVVAPKALARAIGLDARPGLLRAFGLREIAAGAIILVAERPQDWLWLRTAGDLLDGAVLTAGLSSRNPHRGRTALATLAVAPVVALDALYTFKKRDWAGSQR